MEWRPNMLTGALEPALALCSIRSPLEGKYTSHSVRIGLHTEQLLLNIPLEVRLGRFGWALSSSEMAALYFDRTIMQSSASFWFFGPTASPPSASTSSN